MVYQLLYNFYGKCVYSMSQNVNALLPYDIIDYIMHYIVENPYTLRQWIRCYDTLLDWEYLNRQPQAIEYILHRPLFIRWKYLSCNPSSLYLLERDWEHIDWEMFSLNHNAIYWLQQYPERICWRQCSQNEGAVSLLLSNVEQIDWLTLSANKKCFSIYRYYPAKIIPLFTNKSIEMIEYLLETAPYKINWSTVSELPEAIDILKKYPNLINWKHLCKNPYIIDILEDCPGEIDWRWLSSNPHAWDILCEHHDQIKIEGLCANPHPQIRQLLSLFEIEEYDWKNLSQYCSDMMFLEQNKERLHWECLSRNPGIWEVDTVKKQTTQNDYKQWLIHVSNAFLPYTDESFG